VSRWGAYVTQRLDELERGEGDYTDLKRPSAATVAHARKVAAETFRDSTPTPSVVPTADGGIDFVWHKNGYDVEWCITEGEAEFWAHCRATGAMYDEQGVQVVLDALEGVGDRGGHGPAGAMARHRTLRRRGLRADVEG
jgi:hypothetical protein